MCFYANFQFSYIFNTLSFLFSIVDLVSEGRATSRYLAQPDDLADSVIVSDKADMFIGFATVPNYK